MKILLSATLLSAILISGSAVSSKAGAPPYYSGGKLIFVYPKHGSDSNDSSFKHPLKHISEALKRAQPGDTVILMPGTYRENIKTIRDGKPGKPITIVGMPGANIKGDNKPRGREIEITNSYITLANLVVDGHFASCHDENCYHDELLYIHGTPDRYLKGIKIYGLYLKNALGECVRFKYTKDSEIAFSKISHCGLEDFRFGSGTNGEGIYVGTAPEQADQIDRSTNISIHHNSIITYGSECVDVKEGSTNIYIYSNLCSKNKLKNVGGISVRGNENTIERNITFGNKGAGIRLGGDKDTDGIYNSVVENAIFGNQLYELKIMRLPQAKVCGNVSDKNRIKPEGEPSLDRAFSPCPQLTPQDTFYIQLQNDDTDLRTDIPSTVYDVDLFDTPESQIKELEEEGKKVICYFSAGTYENWRPDADQFPKEALGKEVDGWEGERWLDIRNQKVRQIMAERIKLAKEKGCDGIDPDNIDVYQQDSGFNLTEEDAINYAEFLSQKARQLGLWIGLKNSGYLIPKVKEDFNFEIAEECFHYNECDLYKPFVEEGKPVFDIEYDSRYLNNENAFKELCQKAEKIGIRVIVAPEELDGSFVKSCDYGEYR